MCEKKRLCFVRIRSEVLGQLLELPAGATVVSVKVGDFRLGSSILEVMIEGYGDEVSPGGLVPQIEPVCISHVKLEWPKIDHVDTTKMTGEKSHVLADR